MRGVDGQVSKGMDRLHGREHLGVWDHGGLESLRTRLCGVIWQSNEKRSRRRAIARAKEEKASETRRENRCRRGR